MKKQNVTRHALMIASLTCLVTLSTACTPGFEANKSASTQPETNNGSGTVGGGAGSGNWNSVELNGSINGGRFDRTKVVEIDKVAKLLIVRLPFIAGIQIGTQLPLQIREIPGATVGIEPSMDGSSSLVVRLPLSKVLKGVDSLPSSRLPNGDKLPSIPEGELPSVGLTFTNSGGLKGALYLSPTVVGVFVATKFDPYISLTLPIRNEARTRTFGYFTSVPEKTGFDGGFFLSIALPDDLARAIDDLL
jgi:hypothetical protein